MVGPTVARAEVDVDFDGSGMVRQARRIADRAADSFKDRFDALAPELQGALQEIDVGVEFHRGRVKQLRKELEKGIGDEDIEIQLAYHEGMLSRLRGVLRKAFQDGFSDVENEAEASGGRAGQRFSRGFGRGTGGMDRTVKAVLTAIAAMGPQLAALGSGLSATLVATLSSAIVGLGGALLALGGPLSAAVVGTTLLVTAWEDMTAKGTALAGALGSLKSAWQGSADAMGAAAAPGITRFFTELAQAISRADIGAALGRSLSTVADAFAGVVNSAGFRSFLDAMESTIPAALTGLGTGLAGLTQGFATIFAAAGPAAKQLGEQFAAFGEDFAAAMEEMRTSGQLGEFFDAAVESLNALMGVLSPLGQALGNVFLQGSETGNKMLGMLGELAEQFLGFTESLSGQADLRVWFANGLRIFEALLPVVGALSTALADMVTPQVVGMVTTFLDQLAGILPVVGQLLSVIGQLNILGIVTTVLESIATALEPVLPALGELAGVLGTALVSAMVALTPVFTAMADIIGVLAEAITPLVPVIGDALVQALGMLAQYAAPLASVFAGIIEQLGPFLLMLVQQLLPVILDLVNQLMPLVEAFVPLLMQIAPLVGIILQVLTPIIQLAGMLLGLLVPIIAAIVQLVTNIINWVAQWFNLQGALQAVTGAVATVSTAIANFGQTAGQWVQSAIGWFQRLPQTVSTVAQQVGQWFADMGTRVAGAVGTMVSNVGKFFGNLFRTIGTTVSTGITNVVQFFAAMVGRVIAAVSGLGSRIWGWIKDVFARLVSGVTSGITTVVDWFKKLPGRIVDSITGAGTMLYDIGKDIINGLWNGLKDMWGSVTSWVSGAASDISAGFKSVLGIGSPSKVMMAIGEDTVEGFIIGFQKATEQGQGAFRELTSRALRSLTDGLSKGAEQAGSEVRNILGRINDLTTSALKNNQRALDQTIAAVARNTGLSESAKRSTIADLRSHYALINQTVRDAGANLTTTVKNLGNRLSAALAGQETVTKRLEAARKQLDALRQASAQLSDQVAQNLMGQLDLGQFAQAGQTPTFSAIASYVSSMKAKASQFAYRMRKLVAAGLPPALVQELAGLGMDGAIEVAGALLKGSPAELKSLAQDFSGFQAIGTSLGKTIANQMYAVGIEAQAGLVKGLVADTTNLKKAAKTLADRLTEYVKQNLGIRSPSTVFATIGEQVMAGMALGIERGAPAVADALGSVGSQLMGTRFGIPVTRFGGVGGAAGAAAGGGGRSVVVEQGAIQVITPVADPRLVASQVLDRLVVRVV